MTALKRARSRGTPQSHRALDLAEIGRPVQIRRKAVYTAADGRMFTLGKRVGGGARRVYGTIQRCAKCGRQFFGRTRKGGNCSQRCGVRRRTLDIKFSLLVRSAGACRRCGKGTNLQCAHIVSRRYLGVRWDPSNAFCLCASCHVYFTHRPLEWDAYVEQEIGADNYLALKKRALAFVGPVDYVAVLSALDELSTRVRRAA